MKKLIWVGLLVVALSVMGCVAAEQQPLSIAPQLLNQTSASAPAVDVLTQEQAFTGVYERVNPSVVNIRVVLKAQDNTLAFPDFQFQFPGFPQLPETPQATPQQAEGSGFVYDNQGHIVTNNHVVGDADKIVVTFDDGTEAAATLVGNDPDSDLAVIKVDVDPSQLHPATLGESDALKVGQITIAIGNPFGLQGSMSTGIVSGLGRLLSEDQSTNQTQPSYSIPDIIQTDTAINPGNSGGPLLNLSGAVIGVNTAIASPVRANSGVGYAVPVDIVKQVVPELIQNGKVEHPYLGITSVALNADLARAMNLDANQRGVMIVDVADGSPAARANLRGSSKQVELDGLQALVGGDVIVGVDQQEVKVFDDLLAYLVRHTHVGQSVTLHILRDGQPQDVSLTLVARPAH